MTQVLLALQLLASMALSFAATYILVPLAIERLTARGIFGVDVHKPTQPRVPEMGGVAFVGGYLLGMLYLLTAFPGYITPILAALCSILMICLMGMLDDILDLSQRTKATLPLIASLPLIIAVSSDRAMLIPLIGRVQLGLIYPFLLVPIGVTAASNLTNLLAGFNGLEAGMGIIALSSLVISALLIGHDLCAVIAAPMIGALAAFFLFNRYPARIFPGNAGTFSIGAVVAAAVILGDMEVIGVICLMPYIIEFFIKARTKFKGVCFGVLNPDGTLSPPRGKHVESLTHILMLNGRCTEKGLVYRLLLIEAFFGTIAIVVAHLSLYFILLRPVS